MMKIGVQTGGLQVYGDVDAAYRLIKESGFDAADANVDNLFPAGDIYAKRPIPAAFTAASDKECLEYFKPWKDGAEKYGVDNYQAHAPFPSYVPDETGEYNDHILSVLQKTIMGCDYIGCHNLIIHPFFLGYDYQLSPEDEWNLNIERYSALIPTAKKYGVTICLENMFTNHRGKLMAACCSDIATACRYIDTLNEIAGQKCFAFCVDTGHLLLVSKDVKNTLVELGDRINCFHVHDNNGRADQHLAPYMGLLDWKRFVEGLKAIHFDKTLCFETFNIWNTVDPELCPDMMRFIAKAGRMFAARAEQK